MKTMVVLASLFLAVPACALDVFRCTDDTGSVEYRDWPCDPGSERGGKAALRDDTPPPAVQAKAIAELEQQSRAFDERLRARTVEAARRQYESSLREGLAQQVVQPEPADYEPGTVYGPWYGAVCVERLCGRAPHSLGDHAFQGGGRRKASIAANVHKRPTVTPSALTYVHPTTVR